MRVLFCGLGGIGQRHLRNLRSLLGDRLEVHAYRVRRQRRKLMDDLSIEVNADLENDYDVTVHTDLDKAMSVNPDAVFVCNPSSMHIPIALKAARANSHIFIEKPASNSIDGFKELLSVVEANNLICYIGYNFRFHPGLIRLKSLVDGGFFGNIISVQAEIGEYLPNWHKYEDYRQMYAAREDLGGGVILSQIHELDLIYWYFGLPDTIFCVGGKLSDLEIDVEDSASSLMQYRGHLGDFPILLHQDFVQRPPSRTFKIIGDNGLAKIDLVQNQLDIYTKQGELSESSNFPDFKRNDMFLEQTRHFLECINGSESPRIDLLAGLQSLRLALAAKKSLAMGSVVTLASVDLP
ncbi:MAG: Gfo/Idh/MocA family oxidoreductase [Methylococcaceae bacterium]